jgi:predicted PurR-regulated permease PerM
LVLVPLIIWGWYSWPATTALVFTVISIPILIVDNILKPILMARGLTTPMAIIVIGVIGGTLSYGLLGLFLGPVILSVFYELLRAWAWPSGTSSVSQATLKDVAQQTSPSPERPVT